MGAGKAGKGDEQMYYYVIYGKKVYSDLCFPQLVSIPEITENAADIIIRAGKIPTEIREADEREEKKWAFGEAFSWLCNRTCRYTVENGRIITYELKEGGKPDYLKAFLLGYGMAMLHLQRGELAIHCSALEKENRAILVAGNSGSGKSTTTTALLEAGFSLMADDVAVIKLEGDRVICYPAFPYQKLCRDVVEQKKYKLRELIYVDEDKDKFLVPFEGKFDVNGKELCGIFCLSRLTGADRLYAEEITGVNKLYACINNLFVQKLLGEEKYAPAIGSKCLKIASRVPMYLLGRPEETDTVQERTNYIIEQWKKGRVHE